MPLFFFTAHDQDAFLAAADAVDLPDIAAAEREAVATAIGLARDKKHPDDATSITVEVSNDTGAPRILATISLHVVRLA